MLTLGEINQELATLNDWSLEGSAIVKIYTFANFRESLDFVNKVGEAAEKMEHHPDIIINYDKVRLTISTHSAGGLTRKDFELAKQIDTL